MKQGLPSTREAAEALAIQALTFIAQDGERLGRFLAETGLGPAEIRAAARSPSFLAGVLDYIAGDERLIESFAAAADFDPGLVERARLVLNGEPWEGP